MDKMYFVALVLPEELDEKILVCKRWMHEKYGCKVGLKSPAHITLISPFWMPEEMEADFVAELKTIASNIERFSLTTNNIDSFATRTLFISLQPSDALNEAKRKVDVHFAAGPYKIKKENRPFHPHITIATRDLHKKDFAEAWSKFETMLFREAFDATALSLLKHNGQTWDVVFTGPFPASH